MQRCGIYKIFCTRSGSFYIGSSKHIHARWRAHRKALNQGLSPCKRLQRAWNKYGEEAFEFIVLEKCLEFELEIREQFFIDLLNPNLNVITDVSRRFGLEMLERRAASLRARAALITHCPRGHLYDKANTYYDRAGKRICKKCNALRVAAIFASETPKQREKRLAHNREYYRENHERIRKQGNEYAAARREEKREYDLRRRLRQNWI